MEKKITLLGQEDTYRYIWDNYLKSRRIVISRYGDGEFLIMQGRNRKIATHSPNQELTKLLSKTLNQKNQLICVPMKFKLFGGLNSDKNNNDIRVKSGRYFIKNSNYNFYGHNAWRKIDISHDFNLLTKFFIGKTLVVTGNYKECKIAFDRNEIQIDIMEASKTNAFADYKYLKKSLLENCKLYNNIIFALGPTSNILIADLNSACKSNMIDIGSLIGALLNPYSSNESLAKNWTGFPRNASKEKLRNISKKFFKQLKNKTNLYKE